MDYRGFRCLTCHSQLLLGDGQLACSHCQTRYPLDGAIPLPMPDQSHVRELRLEEDHPVTLDEYQAIYDRGYTHGGLMCTDLGGDCDRTTEEMLLSFADSLHGKRLFDSAQTRGICSARCFLPSPQSQIASCHLCFARRAPSVAS